MFDEIKLGAQYIWGDRVVEIDGLVSAATASARDVVTGASVTMPIAELRPRKVRESAATVLAEIPQADWDKAKGKSEVLMPLLATRRVAAGVMDDASRSLGKSKRQIQRYLAKFRRRRQVSTLVPMRPGRRIGVRLLLQEVERVVSHCIQKYYLVPERCSPVYVLERIDKLCRRLKIKAPSQNTIRRRVARLDQYDALSRRHSCRAATEKYGPVPGGLNPSGSLQVIQLDHTEVDMNAVSDDEFRECIGRPWLTVAIDVYSRCILGFYLSLDEPSAVSVAMCISQVLLPKEPWLQEIGRREPWPMFGKPVLIHTDNAAEFRGMAMARGCEELGIIIEHRPVGLPNWGGHIERLIGTLMNRIHCLPGTTFSNPRERGKEYDSEGRACMTLSEIRDWLIVEICTRYHNKVHRGIGMPPAMKWNSGFANGQAQPVIGDPLEILVSFLPAEKRLIKRTGIEMFGLRYWNPGLDNLVGRGGSRLVYYDPRDVSQVYVRNPAGRVITAACVIPGTPRISLRELHILRKKRRVLGVAGIDTALLDEGIETNELIVASAKSKTRLARRRAYREKERHKLAGPKSVSSPPERAIDDESTVPQMDPWRQRSEFPVDHWVD
jgi:putative transposase